MARANVTFKDAYDNVRAVDDVAVGLGARRTTYNVDAIGQLHNVRSSPTELIEHSYDLLGQRLSTTTPDGGRVEYEYDLAGNLVTEQSPVLRADNDSKTHHTYEFGHLVTTDYPDATPDETFTWGGYGGIDPGDNGAGRVVEVEDAARQQTLGYDESGRVDHETSTMLVNHPNNGPWTTEFDYDFLGRLADVSLPDGETVINDYDHGGQLSKVEGEKACTDLGQLTAGIDATQTTITVTENPLAEEPALPFTLRIGGEQLQVTARTATANPTQWTYTVVRGINGTVLEPTNVPHSAGAPVRTDEPVVCLYRYLDRREYDVFGSRAFQAVGNDVSTQYTRNAQTRRLEGQVTTSPAAPFEIQDLRYTYDPVGNLTEARNDVPADVPSLFGGPTRQQYVYDGRYRITHAQGTWDYEPKTRRHYTYDVGYNDVSGNMTSAVQRDWTIDTACRRNCKESVIAATSFDHSSITYAGGSAHRFDVVGAQSAAQSRDYDHDLDGNVTQGRDSRHDPGHRMGRGRSDERDRRPQPERRPDARSPATATTTTATSRWRSRNKAESSFVNPWVTVRNATMWKHIWADTDRLATKDSQDDAYEQKIYFLHKDLQGSTNVATDRVGKVFQHHEYFPSGQVWVGREEHGLPHPVPVRRRLRRRGPSLVDFGQRWYEPSVQAFVSVDPRLTSDPAAIVAEPGLRSPTPMRTTTR